MQRTLIYQVAGPDSFKIGFEVDSRLAAQMMLRRHAGLDSVQAGEENDQA